jgi:D-lactate dehydrogenase (cytochrome)
VPHWRLQGRPATGTAALKVARDPDILRGHLEDAAHVPGGHAEALVAPASEADVLEALRTFPSLLPIGAQSSLTGGATPAGGVLLSTSRLNQIVSIGVDTVRVQAGVSLAALDAALAAHRRYYPPAPTFTGAYVGGTVATNAAGAATFKYGATRRWVKALTVVLPTGDVVDVERGTTCAHPDGYFELALRAGLLRIPVPRYTMPEVCKLSAGYFAAPGMDLIDLFIGSEGTLGVVTEVTLAVKPDRPAQCLALAAFGSDSAALAFVARLRSVAADTWRTQEPGGLDVSAIEHVDARCLQIAHEDGLDRTAGVAFPANATVALLITIELPPNVWAEGAPVGNVKSVEAGVDASLARFERLLTQYGALDDIVMAMPGDHARAARLLALREAVPAAVNARIGRAAQLTDPRIQKTAADMIVPFNRFEEFLSYCGAEFSHRGLDVAVWGHVSDANVHPNVLPRSYADVQAGREAILACGAEAIRLGGAPLAEHGVGRSELKQALLRMMYGEAGINDMRAVKHALDPQSTLAPGVLFAR